MSSSATSSSATQPQTPPRAVASEDAGPDAFGQTGVRQYIGKVLAWCCIIGAILTSAIWYRSTFFQDHAHWQQKDQEIDVHSVHSRLIVAFSTVAEHKFGSSGWDDRGRYIQQFDDRWENSLWKFIGIEVSLDPLNPNAINGFWVQVKWQFIVMCMLAVPVIRSVYLLVRQWREARE